MGRFWVALNSTLLLGDVTGGFCRCDITWMDVELRIGLFSTRRSPSAPTDKPANQKILLVSTRLCITAKKVTY